MIPVAKTETINAPYKGFYETDVEWLASAIDAHNSAKVQQRGNVILYSGWFHVNADVANGTQLFRVTAPSARWLGAMIAFAFENPGSLQLLRGSSNGTTTTFTLDQIVTSGSYKNIVIIAMAM